MVQISVHLVSFMPDDVLLVALYLIMNTCANMKPEFGGTVTDSL